MSSDPLVLGIKVAALEKAVNQLVDAQRENHDSIRKAFQMTDAHLWVLNRICQDIVGGTVLRTETIPVRVNLSAYFDLYNEQQVKEAAAEKAGTQTAKAEDHDVFGGDLSDEDSERDQEARQGQGAGEDSDDAGDSSAPLQLREDGVPAAGG